MTHRPPLAAAVLVVALVAGCGGTGAPAAAPTDSPTVPATTPAASPTPDATATPTPTEAAPTARFEVKAGKASGPRAVEVNTGDRVVLEVVSDKADELHVHGYDKKLGLKANQPGRLTFTANVAGVFEVELHSGVRLCNLRVS